MAGVALAVSDLAAASKWARTFIGLGDPVLRYREAAAPGLDYLALEVRSGAALKSLVRKLEAAGVPVSAGYRFQGPDGHRFQLTLPTQVERPAAAPARKFGHATLTCANPGAYRELFVGVLGFRVSDYVLGGSEDIVFLRCDSDHHGVALVPGPPGLHHHAWEVQGIEVLGRIADALAAAGRSLLWGPGRHGAGDNIAIYHLDASGTVVEHYCDMLQVVDEASYVPGRWRVDDYRSINLWGPGLPEGFLDHVTPVAAAAPVRVS
jgi:catechol 2,3-dioxygenase-like lactoylglutathione lyase family enzyme